MGAGRSEEMKKGLGIALIGLGAFLLVLGGLLRFYAVPQLAKAPLVPGANTGDISTTYNEGVATKLFDPGALATGGDPVRTNVPLKATRTTRGDVLADQTTDAKNGDIAVYDSFQNVVDDKGATIDAGTIRVAFNRVTSELTNCCGANVNGATVNMTGINPLKFPMFTEQKTYDYFDSTVNKAIPIDFSGTQTLDGVECYLFKQKIPATQFSEQEVPGSLVGSPDSSFKAPRMYENDRTLIVEPNTGSIIGGTEIQRQFLKGPSGNDALTLLAATITTTEQTKQDALNDAKDSLKLLNTLKTTLPLICLVLGLICLGVGFWLVSRRDETTGSAPAVS
jgi:hypothetical protein